MLTPAAPLGLGVGTVPGSRYMLRGQPLPGGHMTDNQRIRIRLDALDRAIGHLGPKNSETKAEDVVAIAVQFEKFLLGD